MSAESIAEVRELATGDRFEADLIRYLVAAGGPEDAGSSLSLAQAENLDATADGWDTIAKAAEDRESGAVADPNG